MNKSNKVFIFAGLLLSVVSNLASARGPAPAVPVHSDVVAMHEVAQSLTLIGKLQAEQFVSIASEVTAKVTRIAVQANQAVKKGQLLVQLDDAKAKALLAEARAYLQDEQRKLKDFQRLIKKQAVTQTEFDGQASVVAIAKARLLAAQVFVDNHRLVAPFAGTIGLLDFSEGKTVAIGETLLTLDNLSEMTLDLPVPERYLSMIEIGMDVSAVSRAWPETAFIGKVAAVDSRINPDTLNLRVRLLFDNKSQQLKPGMMMKSQLVFAAVNEPIIEVQSLEYSGTKRFVYVIGDNNKVQRREVTLGARIGDQALIESGLAIGERIVVQGLVNMRDGLTINDLAKEGSAAEVNAKAKTNKDSK
ncbi:efflux RND transporter periplasmic adaptor subunit [Psychromonas sp. SR45-3]|uniref:efflux RND transporter periplasmic adaptor subunit n=1 Tax=Psychromonas sp. SR45-3 TaxID=2760930 RepID=UPI0015F7CAC3|nr:efflux RND transporter periplasmic adaptor subunit [Psychromonas sp. SR45-3]MBB1272253.1 efflux RND transporter periplasmic adaptor subunit [Psychromonas sp. SR45-3]